MAFIRCPVITALIQPNVGRVQSLEYWTAFAIGQLLQFPYPILQIGILFLLKFVLSKQLRYVFCGGFHK